MSTPAAAPEASERAISLHGCKGRSCWRKQQSLGCGLIREGCSPGGDSKQLTAPNRYPKRHRSTDVLSDLDRWGIFGHVTRFGWWDVCPWGHTEAGGHASPSAEGS